MSYLDSISSSSFDNNKVSSYYANVSSSSSKTSSTDKTSNSTINEKKVENSKDVKTGTSDTDSKKLDDVLEKIKDKTDKFNQAFYALKSNSDNNIFKDSKKTNSFDDNIYSLMTNHATIRNGVFYKALKNYYKNQDSIDESDIEETKKTQSTYLSELKDNLSKVKGKENNIKLAINNAKSGEKLNKINGTSDKGYMDKLVSTISEFVDTYNNILDSTKNIDSTKVLRNVILMTSTTSYNSQSLREIGITIGSDNRLSVDEDKLKNANISTIDSLFGHNSYGEYIANKASSLSSLCTSEIKSYKGLETLNKLM